MRYVLDWIKANPVTVISSVVVVLALGVLVWAMLQSSGLRSELQSRANEISAIERLMAENVEIPPEDPDDPNERITGVAVTPGAIEQLDRLFSRMNEDHDRILEQAVRFNRRNHVPLLEGLFPEPERGELPIRARDVYMGSLSRLFRAFNPDDPNAPALNAGGPAQAEELQILAEQLEQELIDNLRVPGQRDVEITEADQREIFQQQQRMLIQRMRQHASQYHIYSATAPRQERFPLHIGEWARAPDYPAMHQVWEGQMELWIQQDIARAIGRANRVNDPDASVLNAPVKRLLNIRVLPGYVGLHTVGGVASPDGDDLRRHDGSYPPPAGGMTDELDGALPDNFYVGPTGRISNPLYDVRHVRLEVIVDDEQLPRFFDALAQTNFMTVLNMSMRDVDEYQALREGYLYGSGNAVRADMIIETIWMRDWTEPLMPDRVRQYVGLDEPEEMEDDVYQRGPGMRGPMQGPMGPGGMEEPGPGRGPGGPPPGR